MGAISNALVIHDASDRDLTAAQNYARSLSASELLPRHYQGKPQNVLLAIEFGRGLGLNPVTAIQMTHIIEGKPTASAGLVGALVRRAGHRLRVSTTDGVVVAELVRSDDPEFTFRAEWDMARAQRAGLTGKDVWKKYPQAMLKARAITEVARDACPEVLAGLNYTAEEVDGPTEVIEAQVSQVEVMVNDAGEAVPTELAEAVDAEVVES